MECGEKILILSSFRFHLYQGNNITISIILILIAIFLGIIIVLLLYLSRKFTKMHQLTYYKEELFNSLCSNIDDLFLIYHLDRQSIEYISPNIERIFGISGKKIRKNPLTLLNCTNPEFQDEIKHLFTTSIVKTNYESEFQLVHPKTNQNLWMIFRLYPVYNSKNNVLRYIINISDLTNEKQTQQILKEALLNAQKANEAKKEFLSHMSHEIKTPINAIIGMTQIAANSLEDKTKVEYSLRKISEASDTLLSIVNNILDMAKIDCNKITIEKEVFSMRIFLKNLEEIISSQAEINHLRYEQIDHNLRTEYLMGDELRLSQILNNCISNSLKFTPEGGMIQLVVTEGERYRKRILYQFIIIDNGIGMSEDYVNRIFIPFEQEDSSIARKYGGSGLGMSITKNLVMLMEGNIYVKSKPDFGTVITINLPFTIPDDEMISEKSMSQKTNPNMSVKYDFSGHHILVVEDNTINLEITCELLRYVNVSVSTAMSGMEAVEMFKNSKASYYDLILMDIQMPDMNGYEATKRIRNSSHPNAKHICIVAMTADSYSEDIAISFESGMNYHVSKPIDMKEFYDLLNHILSTDK